MALYEPQLILGIGELLWDELVRSDGREPVATLGGAPANFAVMAGRLGNHGAILSRVGRDAAGRRALELLDRLPVDVAHLQVDSTHPTGRVTVELTAGQPSYTVHRPAAWDMLELSSAWVQMASRARALCFGSLAQRSLMARQTIQTLVAQSPSSCLRIFDVNLREPFYSAEVLQESFEQATVVKMNEQEAPLVLTLLGLPVYESDCVPHPLERLAERLLQEYSTLELVVITRGERGSLLVGRSDSHDHPGFAAVGGDMVGAGDAFTAGLTHALLRGATLAVANEVANRCGAWVASQSGAMPELDAATRQQLTAALAD